MDLSSFTPTTNSPLVPVFGDNVQDLRNAGALLVSPTGIIVVNSIADTVDDPNSGVTTLRDAILQANADNGEDLIVFDRSKFSNQQTITLSGTELDITHNLDIIAPRDPITGGDLVTVSGNKASRVFEIETGATVTLSGLIEADGSVTGDNGGGIKNSGTLTLDNSTINGNTAKKLYTIMYIGAQFTVIGYDYTAYGGGIYNTGNLTVNNSTLSGNTASSFTAYGAGIYNTGNLTVSNSTLNGNSTSGYDASGGGIYNTGTMNVNNSTLSQNRATGNNGYGGGIFNGDTSITNVSNSTFSGNTISADTLAGPGKLIGGSGEGGGISDSGNLTVSTSTFSGNEVTAIGTVGGGIFSRGNLTVNTSTFSGNKVKNQSKGGGIYTGGGNITNCTFSGNIAGFFGGGICGGDNITNCTFSGNSASIGGGIAGSSSITNSTISGNSASGNGGGIYGDGSITDCTISSNSASIGGGGIYGSSSITNSTISGNTADSGGGISGGGNITNCTISGNRASSVGGGIYNSNGGNGNNPGTVTLLFSTVTQNQATNGGGVYGFNVIIRNTIIASNLLTEDGINPDVFGTFTSYGYNLIGDSTGSTGFSEGLADIVGTSDHPIDPRLAPLDFYGGSTQTIALLPDSPAIDADPTVLLSDPTTDQRGFPRVVNGRADLGAFEFSS